MRPTAEKRLQSPRPSGDGAQHIFTSAIFQLAQKPACLQIIGLLDLYRLHRATLHGCPPWVQPVQKNVFQGLTSAEALTSSCTFARASRTASVGEAPPLEADRNPSKDILILTDASLAASVACKSRPSAAAFSRWAASTLALYSGFCMLALNSRVSWTLSSNSWNVSPSRPCWE